MKYIIEGWTPEVIEATSPAELVRQLARGSWDPAESDAEWMEQAAARAELQSGQPVRSDSAEHFVEDLLAAGLVRREQ